MRFRSKGQPTHSATLVGSFFDLLSMEKKFNFWGIYIMETLSGLFSLIFLIALIVAIVYGIKWWKSRKHEDKSKKLKKKTLIAVAVIVISFIGFSTVNGQIESQNEAQAQKKEKSNYKDDKEQFIAKYKILGATIEELSSKEGDEWGDAIDNSDGDFDVDSTINGIQDKHEDDIDTVDDGISTLHDLDQKIQKNDSVNESDKKTIHQSYLDLKHFADHATSISGSYNDFTDEHNSLDRKTSDHVEELEDL